ncbi:uncharacterized protein LOC130440599 [Diorhabda sublineata]|uniref:uncharacterized protein LOC130440599 n=1 Tax=Diorhabda sublineata TaxID=1163346 RepID=UPI0024E047D3|nr:uncharacterized protein LOC130440599 [Diorhabda sublineata]
MLNCVLKEKNEIINWRRRFLRDIKKFEEEGRKIYYLDETWVNAGHTVNKVWTDTTILSARDAFIRGLSTGLKNPTGKGQRLIILHIDSENGFVEKRLDMFQSKKTGDYHEEMNSDRFEGWFQGILNKLEDGSVIVMDNVSYHSRKLDQCPTSSTRKADIQQWLRERNINFENNMVRALVKENRPLVQRYVVDEMAKEKNKIVLRLPPYHCEFNPIELIWAQIKGEVARKNATFKISDVQTLFTKALNNVTQTNWSKAIQHVRFFRNKMWDIDNLMDKQVEPLIINLRALSTTFFEHKKFIQERTLCCL